MITPVLALGFIVKKKPCNFNKKVLLQERELV